MSQHPVHRLFEWEPAGNVTVVRFTTSHLRDERIILTVMESLEKMVETGKTNLLIDFTGIEAFASFAIGKLIRFNERMKPPVGRLAFCNLTPNVQEIIKIMNLGRMFSIYESEQDALQSFES
ncbi:MAG: STAS domain-containing protein [Gemmataceae bacterium]